MDTNSSPTTTSPNPVPGLLGRFGLATMLGFATLIPLVLTLLVPPWSKVDCQRRQTLYWSERREIHSIHFAGFDFLFAKEKWSREQTPPHPSSDTFFRSIEYQISYPVLLVEWTIVIAIGIFAYVRLARRIFSPKRIFPVEAK